MGKYKVMLVRKHHIRLPGFRSELSHLIVQVDEPLHDDDDDDGKSDSKHVCISGTGK